MKKNHVQCFNKFAKKEQKKKRVVWGRSGLEASQFDDSTYICHRKMMLPGMCHAMEEARDFPRIWCEKKK